MSKKVDLRHFLDGWPYNEEKNARLATGDDGRRILLVRTPMGLEQYELEGRPDGVRPYDCVSALDHQRQVLAEARENATADAFGLDEEECAELFHEGTLFYFRYLHLFQLQAWPYVVRDTERNIGLFDFVHRHAEREEDRSHLEKWRPYIYRMNAIARAMIAAEDQKLEEAIRILDEMVRQIDGIEAVDDETFQFERNRSLTALRELLDQLRKARPLSEVERLESELRKAIETQEFERAAVLRDRLKELKSSAGQPQR